MKAENAGKQNDRKVFFISKIFWHEAKEKWIDRANQPKIHGLLLRFNKSEKLRVRIKNNLG